MKVKLVSGFVILAVWLAAGHAAPVSALPDQGEVARAEQAARAYLNAHFEDLGLVATDVQDVVLRDAYPTRDTGVVHLYFQQRQGGLEVANSLLSVHVTPDGEVVGVGNRFVPNLQKAVATTERALTAKGAYEAAARILGLETGPRFEPKRLSPAAEGPTAATFEAGILSQDEVPVRFVLVALGDGSVVPAWELVVRTRDNRHWLNMWVDANDGRLLQYHDWVGRLDNPDRTVAGASTYVPRQYKVFARPAMNPEEGPRSLVEEPTGTGASPYGWHDTNGVTGADHRDTRGNNVIVTTESGYSVDVSSTNTFAFSLDLTQDPSTYTDAALVNTFYWMNTLHDLHYRFGFDEKAGNFQQNNYGRGGVGGDPVQALVQTNEMITFATPPDGTSPLSRLFIATPITALIPTEHSVTLTAQDGASLSPLPAAGAYFGKVLDQRGIRAPLVQVIDESEGEGRRAGATGKVRDGKGSFHDGCEAYRNAEEVLGKVVLVEEGACSPEQQARNAEKAGAVGMVVVARPGRQLKGFGDHVGGGDVEIPVVMVRAEDVESVRTALEAGVEVQLSSDSDLVLRDSDLDSGVLIHEYGHGVASRLVGGPSSTGCLQAKQSMGLVEGAGDVWALAFTARPGHTGPTARAISTYVFFQSSAEDGGVRGVPYSTDMAVNPFTYGDLASLMDDGMVPHAAGARWAALLWEVYWKLVADHGFTADLMKGTGGNVIFLELLTDSLKLVPCDPTFIEARDAFLLADQLRNGGVNRCSIWRGFARRGLGTGATDGGGANQLAVVESFAIPKDCTPLQPVAVGGS